MASEQSDKLHSLTADHGLPCHSFWSLIFLIFKCVLMSVNKETSLPNIVPIVKQVSLHLLYCIVANKENTFEGEDTNHNLPKFVGFKE